MSNFGSLMKTTLVFAQPVKINSNSSRLNTRLDGGETLAAPFLFLKLKKIRRLIAQQ